jgi:hypothetical protein
MGLVNPLWWFGLGGAAIPVLIHLFHRQRLVRIRWAAMRFLQEIHRKSSQRLRLHHLLLLLLRILIVALLAMAFGRPFLKGRGVLASAFAARDVLVVLDRSMSMDAGPGGANFFETVREKVIAYAEGLPRGSRVALLAFPGDEEGELPVFSSDRETFASAVRAVRPAYGGFGLEAAVARVSRVVDQASLPALETVWFTDVQKGSWEVDAPGMKDGLVALAGKVPFRIVDLVGRPRSNVAIGAPDIRRLIVGTGEPVQVDFTVHHFGPDPLVDQEVGLWVDGQMKSSRRVTVERGGEQTVSFFPVLAEAGFHRVECRLGHDSLLLDNRSYGSVRVSETYPVILIDGEPAAEPIDAETLYLEHALASHGRGGEGQAGATFAPRVRPYSEFRAEELESVSLAVLANVPSLPLEQAEALEGFVRGGGGVICFLGDQVDAGFYNDAWYRGGEGMFPARLGEPVGLETPVEERFVLEGRHPITEPFMGEGVQFLAHPLIEGYVKTEVDEKVPARVVLRYMNSRDPALVERSFGKGRVILVTTGADTEWSTLPGHAAFIPLLDRMVDYAHRGAAARFQMGLGSDRRLPIPAKLAGAAWTALDPEGKRTVLGVLPSEEGPQVRLDRVETPGFYALEAPGEEPIVYAANADPAESDLASTTADRLKERYPGFQFDWSGSGEDSDGTAARADLWKPALVILVMLVLSESFLAWLFGRWEVS